MALDQFAIIESTLREGEQFVGASFTTAQKVEIARLLDAFGVECLELTSPLASPQSYEDAKSITRLGLSCQVLTHVRCRMDDAKRAIETGVDGLDVVIGTSSMLREFSHGKGIDEIIDLALEVVTFVRSQGIRVRFSTEDSFRSDTRDLFRIYEAVDKIGVHRVGIADTVGVATPRQVYELVRELRQRVTCDIEFHGHNDSGCAIANAFEALDAGATHVDTTVLGIGERNGITPLGGLIARLYATNPASVAKYDLPLLRTIDNTVAQIVGVDVPFNNYITGIAAFTHKAGIHAKAILNNPETYEILNPQAFGLTRYISIAHRLTGWNAIKNRSEQLGLTLDDDHIKMITEHIKALADEKALSLDDVDALLRRWANDLLT
ncbi:MAG: homocitrate synthase [Anaerolineae bacterium]